MSPESPALPKVVCDKLIDRSSGGSFELPVLPTTVGRVLASSSDDRCDAQELGSLIESDPSLAAHVLKVSNSAAFAPTEAIVSVQQAVARLGMGTLCGIALSVALTGRVFRVRGFEKTIQRMWMHSAATGAFAKEVARAVRRNVEGAFMCGLLHDVGKPLVLQNMVDICRETGTRPDRPMFDAALERFHGILGAMLITSWGLAPWIAGAVEHHHDYAQAGEHKGEAMLTHLADQLAHWALGTSDVTPDEIRALPVVPDLDLYPDDVNLILRSKKRALEVAEAFA